MTIDLDSSAGTEWPELKVMPLDPKRSLRDFHAMRSGLGNVTISTDDHDAGHLARAALITLRT